MYPVSGSASQNAALPMSAGSPTAPVGFRTRSERCSSSSVDISFRTRPDAIALIVAPCAYQGPLDIIHATLALRGVWNGVRAVGAAVDHGGQAPTLQATEEDHLVGCRVTVTASRPSLTGWARGGAARCRGRGPREPPAWAGAYTAALVSLDRAPTSGQRILTRPQNVGRESTLRVSQKG